MGRVGEEGGGSREVRLKKTKTLPTSLTSPTPVYLTNHEKSQMQKKNTGENNPTGKKTTGKKTIWENPHREKHPPEKTPTGKPPVNF